MINEKCRAPDLIGGSERDAREANRVVLEAVQSLRHRARRVAKHLTGVLAELDRGVSCDIEAHVDFVELAYAALFPEPWLAFVECVHRAVLESETAHTAPDKPVANGSAALRGAVGLARKYFRDAFPELTERAWPEGESDRNRQHLLDAVRGWSGCGSEQTVWETLRAAACCFQPDDPGHTAANVPEWDSMARQWQKHARHRRLPPRPRRHPHAIDGEI